MTDVLARPREAVPTRGGSSGWRPAMRIARRDLTRARGRTLMVLLMVLLPVTAVVALDTLLRTGDISTVEGLPRDLGTAQARIDPGYGTPVRQSPDANQTDGNGARQAPLDEQALREVLPAGTRLLAVREDVDQRSIRGAGAGAAAGRVSVLGLDLRDEAIRGPYTLRSGRPPATADELAVTPELERAGFAPGTTLLLSGEERMVTGVVNYPRSYGTPRAVVGLPEAVGLSEAPVARYYASGPPVLWEDVREVNGLGAIVLSRSVVLDPPPDDEVPPMEDYGNAATTAAVIGLIAVMAVLEVVLLAGPAFAIGARRQRRALALLAAGGGEPRHVRRVVLAQGVLIGLAAALIGVPLGIAVAALGRAPLSKWAGADWGPFEVSARDVALIALLGAGTALLAALAPALIAARQPVVAGLHGRRLTPVRAAAPTAVGLALLALGVLMCGASLQQDFPELWVAFSALPTVLGAVLLAPALLAGLGRAAGRLPLPLRYAVRDADRQRARTAPAVAAIAATVAAVVALGTAAGSDQAEQRAGYVPSGLPGAAVISSLSASADTDWTALERAARSVLPDEPVAAVRGLAQQPLTAPGSGYETVQVCDPGSPAAVYCDGVATSYGGGSVGSSVLVGADALDALAPVLDPASFPAARAAVAGEGAAVAGPVTSDVEFRRQLVTTPAQGPETAELVSSSVAPAVPLVAKGSYPPVLAVVSERVGQDLGAVRTVSLIVGNDLTEQDQDRLVDALSAADPAAVVTVERGYQNSGDRLLLLVLALVAGTLVLAGTLAATSLALVEARPDFATMSQVGARPGTRRQVAAAYAFVLALIGSALGIAAGLVPGVAAAVALTRFGYGSSGPLGSQPVSLLGRVEVPWLLLGLLLVVLPLLVAAVAAAAQRAGRPLPGRHA